MTKRKRKQQELLDNKEKALHSLEKQLDKACGEYNKSVFKKRSLEKELLETDEDTMCYDQIKREILFLERRIYKCQENIRDLTLEITALRQEIYYK